MLKLYVPVTDGSTRSTYLNLQPFWRDASILSGIGETLAAPFADSAPTIIIGSPSSGYLLGALVARHLGIGFAAVRKNPEPAVDSDQWVLATSPPDYQDRHLVLGIRKGTIQPSDRVLAVDDIVDTGGQLLALRRIVLESGATWIGASVVIDLLEQNSVRRDLRVETVLHQRDI